MDAKKFSKCALCGSNDWLRESHIIPSFVSKKIKANSPTGGLRFQRNPNKREQDGDKINLLCESCEQRFSKVEKKFSEEVLKPYHENSQTSFEYGEWLSRFICSVNWRTLYLDIIGFRSQGNIPDGALDILSEAEKILSDFLLGKRDDIATLENHIIPMFEIQQTNSEIKEPNFLLRTGVLDYTMFDSELNTCCTCANLAGILIFTIIRRGKNDIWENTIVNLAGGKINQPPVNVSSPIANDIIKTLKGVSFDTISENQKNKILQRLKDNPKAKDSKAVQYREMDKRIKRT